MLQCSMFKWRQTFAGLTLVLVLATLWLSQGEIFPAPVAHASTNCTSDSNGQCVSYHYYGADLSTNGLMQMATGIDSSNPNTIAANGPWPQNADNYCFLAVVQAIANYTYERTEGYLPYPTRDSEGPASGNPADETSGQLLYLMDHSMQPAGASAIYGSGASRRPFTLANTSHDFGGDPRAQAVATYNVTPPSHYYHQYIYHNGVAAATYGLAASVATYNEPEIAFVNHAEHVVLVAGVWASANPATTQNALIDSLAIYNPWDQSRPYLSGAYYSRVSYHDWIGGNALPDPFGGSSYWWNFPYKENGTIDPDPYMGNYQAGIDPYLGPTAHPNATHWVNNYVTIQRDNDSSDSTDVSLDEHGHAMTGP